MINSLGSIFMYRVFLLALYVLLLRRSCGATTNHLCAASSCGKIRNISYPFRLKGDPRGCGRSEYELACEYNRTVLYLHTDRYYVKSINYGSYLDENCFRGNIVVVADGLQKGNCSSLPLYSAAISDLDHTPYSRYYYAIGETVRNVSLVVFMKCSHPIASTLYVDTKPCIEGAYSAGAPPYITQAKAYSYAYFNLSDKLTYDELRVSDMKDSCTMTMRAFAYIQGWQSQRDQYYRVRLWYKDLHNMMAEGFTLHYSECNSPDDGTSEVCFSGFRYFLGRKYWMNVCRNFKTGITADAVRAIYALPYLPFFLGHFVAAKFILGAPCVLIFLIYKWKRRRLAMDGNIEKFLQAHNNFLPIRYSYSDIKKITKKFRHKLGEGGYGSVYKGVLRSGNEVAVKILNEPKSNGQDFISEVATIGRIHHVNVVQLVGFCFDSSKLALVYDFMPNGSLDKHLFSKDGNDSLDYKKTYEISLGVARGIEYLHRGCDMQILHFDIKPHNILLDQNFTPKVSDFGLARLYPIDHNIVSLTAARGTLGYMAPELFYRDIGGVSYKADVYSFGMLLMEMAGRRRNFSANVERSSQIYFPLWVHDQLSKENEIEMEEVEGEREITRKMIIVAIWCIQLIPDDRPSMSRVLNMLEDDIDKLQLPPKPLLYPSEKPFDEVDTEIELESFSTTLSAPTIYEGYQYQNDNEITAACIV